MIKITKEYTDFNGNKRNETYMFNFTEAEIAEMEMSVNGGYKELIQKIIDTQDSPGLMKIFKDLVLDSYGEKSADGKYFHKSAEMREAFSHTQAYSDIFMELARDTDKAIAFVNGIMPDNLKQQANN